MRAREMAAERAEAVTHACSMCGAGVGIPCTGLPRSPIASKAFHKPRLTAAGITAAPRKQSPGAASTVTPVRSFLETPGESWRRRLKPTSAVATRNALHARRPFEIRYEPEIDSGVRVSLAPRVIEAIRLAVKESSGIETGGALYGWATSSERHVTEVGSAGPHSQRTATSMVFDGDHQASEAAAIEAAGWGIVEIGSHHYHPGGRLLLSELDLRRACGLATSLGRSEVWIEVLAGPAATTFGDPPIAAWAFSPARGRHRAFEVRKAAVV